ncbi:hypothetical protein LCGC14_3104490 [marine sediment metagenome]|uniref:Uncharacterized protein n=1 Tax=marine sediment metagenome TaxID=412755 RepID=A0A0F8W784_9ZZZZ
MRHLRLVPDLPEEEEEAGPFDVVVTNTHPRCADVIYKNIIHTHFEINSEYPHGALIMTYEDGNEIIHECLAGDCIEGAHISVEAT